MGLTSRRTSYVESRRVRFAARSRADCNWTFWRQFDSTSRGEGLRGYPGALDAIGALATMLFLVHDVGMQDEIAVKRAAQ